MGSVHRPFRQLQCDAEHHRPSCPYRYLFCFGYYRKRLQNLCKLHRNSGYLAVQHQRRLHMDDLFYDRIHQCQRNIVLTFAEHKLHGEGAGTAAVQPSLWHLRQLHGQDAGRCGGEQRQHSDRRQCQSDHHPQCHRVRTVLHQFSGDQKREYDHPDRYRACMDEGYGKPLGHPVISTENHAAQLDGLDEVLHGHLCRFLLQRLNADRQHLKQDCYGADHGGKFWPSVGWLHLRRQLHDHKKPHRQRPAIRSELLDPQGHARNGNCKKRCQYEGEVPQYYVEHSHEPIITPEEFDKVQTELARRKQISRQYSGKSIFSSRIVCGDCGSYFGSKVWNSTSKYRRVIWQCNGKFKGEHKCETPHLDEETIKARFVTALNAIIESKDNILEDCRLMQATLTDCTGIDAEIESLLEEIEVVTELTKRCIAENSQTAQNQEEYAARYNGLVERYEKAKARLEQLRTTKAAREAQTEAIGAFMFEVQELDALTEFDEKLWLTVIDTVTVHADGRMTFKFQGGKTLTSY